MNTSKKEFDKNTSMGRSQNAAKEFDKNTSMGKMANEVEDETVDLSRADVVDEEPKKED